MINSVILKGFAHVGQNIIIEENVRVKNAAKISIGSNVQLRAGCQLYAQDNTMDKNKVDEPVVIYLGDDVHIKENVNLSTYGGFIKIGNRSNVGHNCALYGQGGITIGEDVLIGPNCSIISGNHRFDDINCTINKQGTHDKGIEIGNDVWVGANVAILDGIKIGDGAVIGAGSVVTKDVSPNAVVYGSPAVFHRFRGQK